MGWPFTLKKIKHAHYKKQNLTKVGIYKPTKWVLIEPDGKYHYGFPDAGLVNYPTYNSELWLAPTFENKIELPSKNSIYVFLSECDGPKNPWAKVLGYDITGPLMFVSEFSFGVADIEALAVL